VRSRRCDTSSPSPSGDALMSHLALRPAGLFADSKTAALDLSHAVPRGRLDHPGVILLLSALATAALAAADVANLAGQARTLENAYVLVSAGPAALALTILARRSDTLLAYRPLALAVALTAAGMLALDLRPALGFSAASIAADLLFAVGAARAMAVIVPALYRRMDRRATMSAGLDGAIMFVAGMTLVLTLWRASASGPAGVAELFVPLLAVGLLASAGVAAIAAFSLRYAPGINGVWCGTVGVSILGLSWIVWLDLAFRGLDRNESVTLLYSLGILLVTYAWMTWSEEVGGGRRYDLIAHTLVDWLPIGAIVLCVTVAAVPHPNISGIDPAPVGTAVVVLLSIARQRLLIVRERWASRRLAGEVEERAQTMLSLARLEQTESMEQTAARICAEALRLDGISSAAVYAFGPQDGVVPIAMAGECRHDETLGEQLTTGRADHIRSCASAGAWIDTPHEVRAGSRQLRAEAFSPMRWDDRIVGVVAMGTTSREDAQRLALRLSTVTEFGVVSAALLGPMLAEHWRKADIRSLLDKIITERAFTPVFQAVVRLKNREIIGFEALTRFADGARPDMRFLEAHNAGMSIRLETACIAEQLEAAAWLPPGTWVSLNVSPSLAIAVVPLVSALERADRDVVLEITEHVEIGDYRVLMAALDLVRGRARLAVDDAGAGYAGLRHILELRPQFVKLDLSLVRHVDTDPARQAMVAGMAHFAHNAGCELIAEGIETEEELTELIRLGISLGQGYLFGKPCPVV
jgi:EAL domain-containing protein (putative c-di-GMP-specific phosphodiesterase class I)